jgi:hypothetical protein
MTQFKLNYNGVVTHEYQLLIIYGYHNQMYGKLRSTSYELPETNMTDRGLNDKAQQRCSGQGTHWKRLDKMDILLGQTHTYRNQISCSNTMPRSTCFSRRFVTSKAVIVVTYRNNHHHQ